MGVGVTVPMQHMIADEFGSLCYASAASVSYSTCFAMHVLFQLLCTSLLAGWLAGCCSKQLVMPCSCLDDEVQFPERFEPPCNS